MKFYSTNLKYHSHRKLDVILISLFSILLATCVINVQAAESEQVFNHDETDFPLDSTHVFVSCDSCHIKEVFLSTPTQCWRCHSQTGHIRASSASPQHISTTQDCEFCHQTGNWTYVPKVDHFAVLGSCQSCHNGVTSVGKNPGHIQSSEICDDCHRTFSWAGAAFDHTNIMDSCISCHNGVTATGKNPTHMLTTDTCEDCHGTSGFSPVIRVDHTAVTGTCFSCHNGIIARGKETGHPEPSSNDCALCHSSLAWLPATL